MSMRKFGVSSAGVRGTTVR